jgi:hypothetical protein
MARSKPTSSRRSPILPPNTKINTDIETIVGKPAGPGGTPPAVPGLKGLLNAALTNKVQKTSAKNLERSNGRALVGHVVVRIRYRTPGLLPLRGD